MHHHAVQSVKAGVGKSMVQEGVTNDEVHTPAEGVGSSVAGDGIVEEYSTAAVEGKPKRGLTLTSAPNPKRYATRSQENVPAFSKTMCSGMSLYK